MSCRLTAALILYAFAVAAGHVEWSDGMLRQGKLLAGANNTLRLHDGARVREWPVADVARVTLRLVDGRLEKAWRFVEAGQTRKEEWGDPFPVAELEATVWLTAGGFVSGHLLSTTLYLESEEGTEKVIVKSKLRGAPGETINDLRYPVELVFHEANATTNTMVEVRFVGAEKCRFAAVSRQYMNGALVAPVRGGWRVGLEGGDVVAAVCSNSTIRVGWRGNADKNSLARIRQGLVDLKDFFDGRELLAAAVDEKDATVCHTLLLLHRLGETTLSARATQPWRLEVWRWRLGEGDDISAVRRVVLFRGIKAAGEPLPAIKRDDVLAEIRELDADITIRCEN